MRELTVVYKWDSGKEGSFTHPQFPEPIDVALDCTDRRDFDDPAQADAACEALAESAVFQSLYWGWFRQVLVTWRADAKRHRLGNKSVAPKSESETAVVMQAEKVPTYKEPSESIDGFSRMIAGANAERAKKGKAPLDPAQIAELQALIGITEY